MIYKETFTNSAEYGIISQRDFFDHDISKQASLSGYYVIQENDFVYNPRISVSAPVGPINCNKLGRKGVMSPLYTVFRARDVDFVYLEYFFKTKIWHSYMRFNGDSGARSDRFSIKDELFFEMPIPMPDVKEQKVIGDTLKNIDNLITLHQCKQKSKSDEGKDTAKKADAKNLANDWEQRKFRECVIIERGGSPRPIDDYITSESDGLNWIKIGDAPEQGNYITKTAEKIKPSGLPKTRQVQIGDLILSNSMSFGKPYIMAINGCIHDGWLLIRDTEHRFNLLFLCQLLGTPQMLSQYKSSAAGSTVNNLNKELVGNTTVLFPDRDEQQYVGELFSALDNLITLHRCKDFSKRECCETLKIHKKHKTMATTWEQRKANDLFDSYADKGHPELPVLSATQDSGMVRRDDIGKNVFHDKSNEIGYKRVLPGQFVIHLRSFQGGFAHSNIEGITSPAYTIFGFKPVEEQYDLFWKYIFSSEEFIRRLETVTYGIRDGRSISYDEFLTMKFVVPSYVEQVKIAHCLISIDNLITLHQRG